jgi:hypothetical protein
MLILIFLLAQTGRIATRICEASASGSRQWAMGNRKIAEGMA